MVHQEKITADEALKEFVTKYPSESTAPLRSQLEEMPRDWKPVQDEIDCVECAFWDQDEFLAYIDYNKHQENPEKKVTKKILWNEPSYSKICFDIAFDAVERNALPEAVEALELGLILEPDHPKLHCELGLVFNRMGRPEDALKAYQSALESREWNSPGMIAAALRGQGATLIELNQFDEATESLQASLEIEPNNEIALNELGYIEHLRSGGGPAPGGVSPVRSGSKLPPSPNDLFNDEEWLIMIHAPFIVFVMISAADGTIDKKEVKIFNQAMQAEKNSLLAELIQYGMPLAKNMFDRLLGTPEINVPMLSDIAEMVDAKLSGGAALDFKKALYGMAEKIAKASGGFLGFGSKISREEKETLNRLAEILKISQ